MDPEDWRPRECNIAADLVADHIIANRANVDTMDCESLYKHLDSKDALQVFLMVDTQDRVELLPSL